MTTYADLSKLPEDDRIQIIAENALKGLKVGFVVDDDAAADRYSQNLTLICPCGARHTYHEELNGPTAKAILASLQR